jgi:hypothetical protein
MAKTIAELSVKVLEELGRLPQGQVAPAARLQKVKDAYNGLYEYLENKGLVNWGSTDSVPEWSVYPLTMLISGRVGRAFGVDTTPYILVADNMVNMIAEQIANPSEEDTTPGVFF